MKPLTRRQRNRKLTDHQKNELFRYYIENELPENKQAEIIRKQIAGLCWDLICELQGKDFIQRLANCRFYFLDNNKVQIYGKVNVDLNELGFDFDDGNRVVYTNDQGVSKAIIYRKYTVEFEDHQYYKYFDSSFTDEIKKKCQPEKVEGLIGLFQELINVKIEAEKKRQAYFDPKKINSWRPIPFPDIQTWGQLEAKHPNWTEKLVEWWEVENNEDETDKYEGLGPEEIEKAKIEELEEMLEL